MGELQYFRPSTTNNNTNIKAFDIPFMIYSKWDLEKVRKAFHGFDVLEWAIQERPNSQWIIKLVTNITFFAVKLRLLGPCRWVVEWGCQSIWLWRVKD